MKRLFFIFLAVINKCCYKIKSHYYQFYNIQNLKWKGAKIGNNLRMEGKTAIYIGGSLQIGDNFICRSGFKGHILGGEYSSFNIDSGGVMKIGDNSGISATNINCKKSVQIGSHVLIGAGCLITDSNHHSLDWKERCLNGDNDIKSAPVTICDYVFIGARSIILKGVTIGENSIIAAGSVVVNDIPANCMAGGNPCKVIKFLI